jgi:hypothetical protein
MLMSVVISVLTISRTRYSALQWTKIDHMTMTTTTTMTMTMTMTVRTTLLQIRYVLLGLLYLLPLRAQPRDRYKGSFQKIFSICGWVIREVANRRRRATLWLMYPNACTSGLPVQPETTVIVQGSELTIV